MPKVWCNRTTNTLGLTSAASLLMLQQLVFLLQVLTRLQEAMATLTALTSTSPKGYDHATSCTPVDISTKPQVSNSFYEALEVQKHLSFCSKVGQISLASATSCCNDFMSFIIICFSWKHDVIVSANNLIILHSYGTFTKATTPRQTLARKNLRSNRLILHTHPITADLIPLAMTHA